MAEIGMEDSIRMLIIRVTEFTNGLVIIRNAGLSFFQGINTLDHLDEFNELITIYRRSFAELTTQKAAKSINKAELDEFESFKKEMAPYLDKIEKNLRAVGY